MAAKVKGFHDPLSLGERIVIDVRYDHPRISHDDWHGKTATVIKLPSRGSGVYGIECEGKKMMSHRSWLYSLEERGI